MNLIFYLQYNENTLGYALAKTKVTCLYINKMLMGKLEIKTMVDLKTDYNYA